MILYLLPRAHGGTLAPVTVVNKGAVATQTPLAVNIKFDIVSGSYLYIFVYIIIYILTKYIYNNKR